MESPISAMLAEIYLQYLEEKYVKHCLENKEITYYKRLSNIDEPTRCNNDLLIYKISYIFNTFLSILLRMRYVQKNLSRKSKFTFYS